MDSPVSSFRQLMGELRRRRVVKVAVAYGAVAFVVAQVSDVVFRALELPDWSLTLVVVLALAGFPFALLFAWIFDVGPEMAAGALAPEPAGQDAAPARAAPSAPTDTHASPTSPPSRLPIWAFGGVIVLVFVGIGLTMRGVGGTATADAAAAVPEERTLVVLPVRTAGAEAGDDWFADAVGEEVQSRLSRVPGVRVTSWTSALSYRGSGKRVSEIAEELGVTHVVEVSAQNAGGRLRVSAGLVDAQADRSLWSERFERATEDLFGIQAEITEQIVQALSLQLTPEEVMRVAAPGTQNLEAFELVRRGREVWMATDAQGFTDLADADRESAALFRRALELDPGYAAAHAWLSRYFAFVQDLPFQVRVDSAGLHARRAIELGPHLPDGYWALSEVYLLHGWVDLARLPLRRALELDPNHVEALLSMSRLHLRHLEVVESAGLARRAVQISPVDPTPHMALSRAYRLAGAWEEARAAQRQGLALGEDPEGSSLRCYDAWDAVREGRLDAVRQLLDQMLELDRELPFSWRCIAAMEWALGNPATAIAWWERYLEALPPMDLEEGATGWIEWQLADAWRALGDKERSEFHQARAEAAVEVARRRCSGRCMTGSHANLLAFRGRTDEAVAVLRAEVSNGWIDEYPAESYLRWSHPQLVDDPIFLEFMGELRTYLDLQRELLRRDG